MYSQHNEAFLIMAMFTRERYRTVIITGLIFGVEKLTVHTGPVLGPVHMGKLSYHSRPFRAKTSKSMQWHPAALTEQTNRKKMVKVLTYNILDHKMKLKIWQFQVMG